MIEITLNWLIFYPLHNINIEYTSWDVKLNFDKEQRQSRHAFHDHLFNQLFFIDDFSFEK